MPKIIPHCTARPTGWRFLRAASPTLLLAFLLAMPRPVLAADAAPQDFNIPAGDARTSLSEFSDQASGHVRILYSAEAVDGVYTKAVEGHYVARRALEMMLAGTVLESVTDADTGDITIRRRARSGPPYSADSGLGPIQTDVSLKPTFEIVQMSAFEVTTTQGHGYTANNSATAFKTNEALMNLPQGDIVITSDLINDIGYENSSDLLQYFGVSALTQSEFLALRGSAIFVEPYLDEMPESAFYEDNSVMDSYEVIKGPAQVLYLNAGLSGVVLKATKKPLPYAQYILTGSIDENGLYRMVADFTGPIGNIGAAQVSFRFVGVNQHGKTYFDNVINNRSVLFPEFGIKYYNTTVRIYYDFQTTDASEFGQDILTPSGSLYTGAGRKVANMPRNNIPNWQESVLYAEALQKISDNWENRLSAAYWHEVDWAPTAFPIAVNYTTMTTGTETFLARLARLNYKSWTVLDDWQGHYYIWKLLNRDAFGFSFSDQTDKNTVWTTANFAGTNSNTLIVPINSRAAINSIAVPAGNAYSPPATGKGALYEEELSAIYWQHTIDVIPNWLTLIGGLTWDNIKTDTVGDWGVLPFQSTFTPVSMWTHRFGAVVHLTERVSLYALNSTTFTPPATGLFLENGQLPPSEVGTGNELGIKWNFLGGKISGEAAWFKMVTTNDVQADAGILPNGAGYAALIGSVTEEGIDGDASITLLPGWQVIGSWYAGHQVDPFGQHVPYSYDNSLGIFTRYGFDKAGTLHGLAIGGGLARVGGRWASTAGLSYAGGALPAIYKLQTGSLVNAFVDYALSRHWMFRLNCANVLNRAYPLGEQSAYLIDPSAPRTFRFETTFKY